MPNFTEFPIPRINIADFVTDAEDARDAAILAQTGAETAETNAEGHEAGALAAKTAAELAALAAGAPIVTSLTAPTPANGTIELLKLDAGLQVWEVQSSTWTLLGWLVGPTFDTVADLLASTATTLGPVGQIVEAGGFRYKVVTTGEHVTTAGGVKLEVLPGADGVSLLACGAIVNSDIAGAHTANILAMTTALAAGNGKIYASPDNYYFGDIAGNTQLIERTEETIIDWKGAHIIVDGEALETSTTSTAFVEVTGAKLISKNYRFTDRTFDLDTATIYRGVFPFTVIANGADIQGCEFGPFHVHAAQSPFSVSSLNVSTGRVVGAKTVGPCICDDVYYGLNAFGADGLNYDATIDRALRFLSLRGLQNSKLSFVGREGLSSSSNLLIAHQQGSGDTKNVDIDCKIGTIRGAIALDASEDVVVPKFENVNIRAEIGAIGGSVTTSTHLVGCRQFNASGVTQSSGDYILDGLNLDINCAVRVADVFRAFTEPGAIGAITLRTDQRFLATRAPANTFFVLRDLDNMGLRRGMVGDINVDTLAFPVSKIRGQGGYRATARARVDGYSGGVSAVEAALVFGISSEGNVTGLSVLGTSYKFDDAAAGGDRTFTFTASGGNILLGVTGYTAGTTMEIVGDIRLIE